MARASLREQLVDGSARVFLEQGFNAASVNDIVQAAGVPKGSFYNHFPSKEALAVEVLRRYVDGLGLGTLAASQGSALDGIRAHMDAVIAARAAAGVRFGCLLGNFSTDTVALSDLLRDAVDEGFARWIGALAGAIRRAQDAGEIRNGTDACVLARYVVSGFEGAVALAKTLRGGGPIEDFLTVTFGTVLR
jgi:TetR/AcrR family transcriptional repressor of nem operon